MGKSDQIVFEEYLSMLDGIPIASSTAFLGLIEPNKFSDAIFSRRKDFYDLRAGNWQINSQWTLIQRYDLIVCTRCPYFARDPADFIRRCKLHLNPGGKLLVDWCLGDHWRFEKFKVGWVRDGEHEFAYAPDNFLYSCLWRTEFVCEEEVQRFWKACQSKPPYDQDSSDNLTEIIHREVPSIVDYQFERIRFKFLWPDSPQLYIITLSTKEML